MWPCQDSRFLFTDPFIDGVSGTVGRHLYSHASSIAITIFVSIYDVMYTLSPHLLQLDGNWDTSHGLSFASHSLKYK